MRVPASPGPLPPGAPTLEGNQAGLCLALALCRFDRGSRGAERSPDLELGFPYPLPCRFVWMVSTYRTQGAKPHRCQLHSDSLAAEDRPSKAFNPTVTVNPFPMFAYAFIVPIFFHSAIISHYAIGFFPIVKKVLTYPNTLCFNSLRF